MLFYNGAIFKENYEHDYSAYANILFKHITSNIILLIVLLLKKKQLKLGNVSRLF